MSIKLRLTILIVVYQTHYLILFVDHTQTACVECRSDQDSSVDHTQTFNLDQTQTTFVDQTMFSRGNSKENAFSSEEGLWTEL